MSNAFEDFCAPLDGGVWIWGLVTTALGFITVVVFIFRWQLDSTKRTRERLSISKSPDQYLLPTGRNKSYLSMEGKLPSVAFVMPVKWGSIKSASPVANWKSQVLTAYQGDHESIFVVESADDGAVPILEGLKEELKDQAKISIKVAGLSTTCTQKIHNMVAGVNAVSKDMEYVFFLDANGHMHPGTLGNMVSEMESDDKIFAASGFPLDIPQEDSSVWAWTMCQYRYVILSEFSARRATFPWGGAMLMRRKELDEDACEVKSRWINGGYSDDLLVGACAGDYGRTISTPIRAIFPNTVKKDVTFAQSWDFMRRQAFTLTTFGSTRHCCIVSGTLFIYATFNALPLPSLLLSVGTLFYAGGCFIVEQKAEDVLDLNVLIAVLFLMFFYYAMFVQRRYLRNCWNLARELSPEHEFTEFHVSRWMQIKSFMVETTLAPFIALSLVRRSSEWGGIMYYVSGGKVVRVERPAPKEPAAPVTSKVALAPPIEMSQSLAAKS